MYTLAKLKRIFNFETELDRIKEEAFLQKPTTKSEFLESMKIDDSEDKHINKIKIIVPVGL